MTARPSPRRLTADDSGVRVMVAPEPAPHSPSLAERLSMPLVLLGALALRLWNLGARSVWVDEGSTWTAASAPLPELIRLCAQKDASPPLFYLLTAASLRLGDDEAHLRLVAALASVGIVWITYRIARLFMERIPSTLAAAIVALSPFQLMYAQEARTYALVAFLSAASLYLFLRAAVFGRERAWIPYIVVSALGLYTQSLMVIGFGVQGAIVLLVPAARRRWKRTLLAAIVIVAFYLPWLFVTMTQMSHLGHSHWYLRAPDARGVFHVIRALFLSPIPLVTPPPGSHLPGLDAVMPRILAHGILILLPLVPLLIAARDAWSGPRRSALMLRILIAGLVLPLVAVLVVSFRTPLWLPRYFVFLTPFVAILLAYGIASLRPRALTGVWAGLVLLAGAYACFRYDRDYTKEPWRQVVRAIGQREVPGETAVLVPFDVDPFRFYNVRLERPVPVFEVSHPSVPFSSGYTRAQMEEMESVAAARTAGYDDVWIVLRHVRSPHRAEVAVRTERVAASGRTLAGRWKWESIGSPIRVIRYQRDGAALAGEGAAK